MEKARKLRELMSQGMVVAPFCMDAFQAKIVQSVGFEAVYMTGWGTSAQRGFPDVGLITQTEMVQNARYIANAVDIPVICDADTGYGNPINVWRTVREYESAGVAAVHIEDQVFPKKCGFFAGKRVITIEEHIQKIKAALDARQDKDFVIIARSDALEVNGWEDAIRRCHAYYNAGADLIFLDGIRTREDLETYAHKLQDLPKLYNAARVHLPMSVLAEMGFRLTIHSVTTKAVYRGVKEALEGLKEKDIMPPTLQKISMDEVNEMMGLPTIYEMEQLYKV